MAFFRQQKPTGRTAGEDGAPAGSYLRGFAKTNEGIRIRIEEPQPRGSIGPIKGPFVIVDVGNNPHSDTLRPLLNQPTNALDVVTILRRKNVACINVANLNILSREVEESKPD